MASKRKPPQVNPDFLSRQKASLVRRHRATLLLNDSEVAAINLYCKKFKVKHKSAFFREAIMTRVIKELEDNHPTLF